MMTEVAPSRPLFLAPRFGPALRLLAAAAVAGLCSCGESDAHKHAKASAKDPATLAEPTSRRADPLTAPMTSPSAPVAAPAPAAADDQAATASATDGTLTVAGLVFTVPEGWIVEPPANTMRLAQMKIPAPEGSSAEAALVVFSSFGGGARANIDRWRAQVSNPEGEVKEETFEVGGLSVTTILGTGTFSAGGMAGPATPMSGWTLAGAIVTGGPAGEVQIKATGPKETIIPRLEQWNAFLRSVKAAP